MPVFLDSYILSLLSGIGRSFVAVLLVFKLQRNPFKKCGKKIFLQETAHFLIWPGTEILAESTFLICPVLTLRKK